MQKVAMSAASGRILYNPPIELLSREELLALQWRKLSRQLERLYHENPFYARRLRAAGVTPEKITSLQAYRERVPLCDKRDLLADQQEAPPVGSRLGVDPGRAVQVYLTSGTTGVGQEVYGRTWSDVVAAGTSMVEAPLYWAGLRRGDRVYSMTPVATLAFGLLTMEAFRAGGYLGFQVFMMDSVAKLGLMKRFTPHAMILTPAHLARLTTICEEQGVVPRHDYPGLKAILIAGQSYPVELIERSQAFWGATVFDAYGSSQGGTIIAANCEHGALLDGARSGMHILEHRNLLEIVDPKTGRHVEPGEEGMGVITTLDREGSPLLRFRTDDKMRYLGHDCTCGRTWSMIESGTMSRYDDMMKVRGMNIWPQVVDEVVFAREVIDEYAGSVSVDDGGLEQIEIRYALKPAAAGAWTADKRSLLIAGLVRDLKERTNVTFGVREVPRSELPTFEFKAVRWTSTVQADLQKKVW